jgi:hypothetical protein
MIDTYKKPPAYLSTLSKDECLQLSLAKGIIDNCKLVQRAIKDSKIENELGKKIIRDGDTRWLSKLTLMRSVNELLDQIVRLKNDNAFSLYLYSRFWKW